MKITFETKGEGENKKTTCSIEFEISGESIEKVAKKVRSVVDNISDLTEDKAPEDETK